MIQKYNILLSAKAKEDIKNIVFYIKNVLKEPDIAGKYARMMEKEINELCYFPQRNMIIDDNIIVHLKIRKHVIKNYIIFYRISEENSMVNIERILHSSADWINEL